MSDFNDVFVNQWQCWNSENFFVYLRYTAQNDINVNVKYELKYSVNCKCYYSQDLSR